MHNLEVLITTVASITPFLIFEEITVNAYTGQTHGYATNSCSFFGSLLAILPS